MATRTITALYESRDDAQRARDDLSAAGVTRVDVHAQDQAGDSSTVSGGHEGGGFMDKLKNFFGGHDDTHTYAEGVRRGHYLLTAQVDDDRADEAVRILESSQAVDVDQAQESWRSSGWTGASASSYGASSATTSSQTREFADDREQIVPVVEEELKVGKREVERGGVRVRSYIVEEPVREQVTLREEHVDIERRAANRPVTDADALLQEREINLTETAEEAVVAKDAVVREELVIRKDTEQRTEEISDTVRHTEVDVDDARSRRDV